MNELARKVIQTKKEYHKAIAARNKQLIKDRATRKVSDIRLCTEYGIGSAILFRILRLNKEK